jgi:hypothetical protein
MDKLTLTFNPLEGTKVVYTVYPAPTLIAFVLASLVVRRFIPPRPVVLNVYHHGTEHATEWLESMTDANLLNTIHIKAHTTTNTTTR